MAETNAGAIIGTLRLNIRDFEDGIAKAMALADKLDGKNVDVQVKVDTAGAETKLAAVAASEDKVDAGNKRVASSSQQAGKGMGGLAMAIIGLGPAIVPLAAATTGLAVGFGAMGAAGVLAIVGITKEMKAGTPLGGAYTTMLDTLEGDLTKLSHTAADGVLAPFQKEVATLQGQMPALNGIIGEFSVITGKTAGLLVSGLVAAFIALEPLARDAGVYVLDLSQRFAALMSGPGVVSFGDYVRSVFPQVMQAVESIVGAALHLVAALAPLGLGTLGILRTFTDLINAIPVDVLAVLAQGAVSVYLGFKTFSLLSGGITAVGAALQGVGVSAETAAVGMRALNIAAGAIGILITAATLIFSANAEATRQNTQAANDYADALRASNGVIDQSIRQMAVKKLSDEGAFTAANQLGISVSRLTDAALGNPAAIAEMTAATKPFADAIAVTTHAVGDNSKETIANGLAAQKLRTAWGGQNTDLKNGIQTWKNQTAATKSSTGAQKAAADAQQALAAKVGTTGAALVLATAAQKTTADAAAQAAAKMYLENDAAGILKNALDRLNGETINAAQAQNSFDSSLVNMGDHVNATGKKITFTTTSIGNMSSASVALRGQLNGQVTNLQAVVEANGGLADSTGKARAQMVTMRKQIIDNAVAHGVNRKAVTDYVDKLLAIPRKIPPTKLDVDKAAADKNIADMQKRITAIKQGKAPGLHADSTAGKATIAALQLGIDRIKQGKAPGVTANITPGQARIVLYQKQIDAIKQKLATGLDANPRAARLAITALQAKIDAIKQGKPPGLDANSTAGNRKLTEFQDHITGIKQRTPPGLTVATAAGIRKIGDLQATIDRLNGKTVGVVIQYSANGVRLTSPSSLHHGTGAPKAAGGPIDGPGTGTSDSVPIMASKGEHMLTAGDVNAAGGHGAVMAWRKSLHGYAGGGPIVITMPTGAAVRAAFNTGAANGATQFPAPSLGGGGGAGGAGRWASMALQVLMMLGQPASSLAGNLRRINFESGGNPNAINLTDSNAKAGHPSIGLMQTILGTFNAYAGPFRSRGQRDPFADIYAGDNYAIHRYGSVAAVDPLRMHSGYDMGGVMMPGGVGKNYGTKAERVLSGSQTDWFEAGRAAAGKSGSDVDMSGVRADLAEQTGVIRGLVAGFGVELNRQARTIQTMQRQMASA